jgi:homoserine O-acetyltransferase
MRILAAAFSALVLATAGSAVAATPYEQQVTQGDYVIKDFKFRTGETLPALKIHYYTLGAPKTDAAGKVTNAVLILHGTGGTGRQFLSARSSPTCCSRRAACWTRPRTTSSCPTASAMAARRSRRDGLRAKRSPNTTTPTWSRPSTELVTKGLEGREAAPADGHLHGLHARLHVGRGLAARMSRALMPLACLPVEIAGRNRLWRKMAIER